MFARWVLRHGFNFSAQASRLLPFGCNFSAQATRLLAVQIHFCAQALCLRGLNDTLDRSLLSPFLHRLRICSVLSTTFLHRLRICSVSVAARGQLFCTGYAFARFRLPRLFDFSAQATRLLGAGIDFSAQATRLLGVGFTFA